MSLFEDLIQEGDAADCDSLRKSTPIGRKQKPRNTLSCTSSVDLIKRKLEAVQPADQEGLLDLQRKHEDEKEIVKVVETDQERYIKFESTIPTEKGPERAKSAAKRTKFSAGSEMPINRVKINLKQKYRERVVV